MYIGQRSRKRPDLFINYYTEVLEKALKISLDAPLTLDPYIIMLSVKQVSFSESLV